MEFQEKLNLLTKEQEKKFAEQDKKFAEQEKKIEEVFELVEKHQWQKGEKIIFLISHKIFKIISGFDQSMMKIYLSFIFLNIINT